MGKTKRYATHNRSPKGEIPKHQFSEQEAAKVIQFLYDNLCIMDRAHTDYSRPKFKENLWKKISEDEFPGMNWMTVRLHFDNAR